MTSQKDYTYEWLAPHDVTTEIMEKCTGLFNDHYGVWGEHASLVSPALTCGSRVKMNAIKMREQCLYDGGCSLALAKLNGEIVGHSFASTWKWESRDICWITQLVVNSQHRNLGIAKCLVQEFGKRYQDHLFGVTTSHPFTVKAVANLGKIDFSLMAKSGQEIIEKSSIPFLKHAKVYGSLFSGTPLKDGAVSSVDTKFFVDHKETSIALHDIATEGGEWQLGQLPEGHEFFAIVNPKIHWTP